MLYLDLWSDSGVRLSNIFKNSFFNQKIAGEYYKAVATLPVWDWKLSVDNPFLERELAAFLGASKPLVNGLDTSRGDIYLLINSANLNKISIDCSSSKLLIASTRSEAKHIDDALTYLDSFLGPIKQEIYSSFNI